MVKTNFEKWEQLLLGLVTGPPASPGGPNGGIFEDISLITSIPARPVLPDMERIRLDDLPDYLEKHHLRVIGGNPNTWPPTIYTGTDGGINDERNTGSIDIFMADRHPQKPGRSRPSPA